MHLTFPIIVIICKQFKDSFRFKLFILHYEEGYKTISRFPPERTSSGHLIRYKNIILLLQTSYWPIILWLMQFFNISSNCRAALYLCDVFFLLLMFSVNNSRTSNLWSSYDFFRMMLHYLSVIRTLGEKINNDLSRLYVFTLWRRITVL